jgi:hypothetical protein
MITAHPQRGSSGFFDFIYDALDYIMSNVVERSL